MVRKYKSIIKSIDNRIEGIYTLTFEPLTGNFRYSPGQFLHLAIDREYDGIGQWPESRCFSIQTSPRNELLKITYAVKGEFTKMMEKTLTVGSDVWLKMPYGDLFEQEHSKDHTVFISGGTGITPFLSLFTDSSFAAYSHPVLYAGFRSSEFNIYQQELNQALNLNHSLTLNLLYQDTDGILDIQKMLEQNGTDTSYFISGPPVMIKAFKKHLLENGVVNKYILTDDWE